MQNIATKTHTYTYEIGMQAFASYASPRISQCYTGVLQNDGRLLVVAVGAAMGMTVSSKEWGKEFGVANSVLVRTAQLSLVITWR